MADAHSNTPVAEYEPRAERLLFVGWDGVDSRRLQTLLAAGRLPYLNSLVESGAILKLAIPRPAFPAAAWTSLATGKRPHEHGVLHEACRVGGSPALLPISRHEWKCLPLWNVLSRQGLVSHVVGWPVTHPADSHLGICVSDQFACIHTGDSYAAGAVKSVAPPEAAHGFYERRMTPQQVEDVTLAQLLPEYERGAQAYSQVETACRELLAKTATLFRSIRWCLDTPRWNFAACVFPGIRCAHGIVSRLGYQTSPTAELCETILTGCYEHHDLLLGQLLSQLEVGTHVAVVCPAPIASAPGNEGLAVVSGPGVSRQAGAIAHSLLDVAPTILAMFGVPHGRDMGGRPLKDLFVGGLASQTLETWDSSATHDGPHQIRKEAIGPDDDHWSQNPDPAIQHLVDLGYVDPMDVIAREAALQCDRTSLLNRAISMLDAGLCAPAINALDQVVREFPDWYDGCALLAESYYRAGNYPAAREQINRLISCGFENPHLYLLSAAIGIATREFDRALTEIAYARRGATMPPEMPYLMGRIQLGRRDFPAAEQSFHQAINSGNQMAQSLDGLATVKLHVADYENAAVFALDALAQDMRMAKAHYHLAIALYFLNRPHESLQALCSWAALEPQSAAPHFWMIRVHQHLLNDLQQAELCRQHAKQIIQTRRRTAATAPAGGTSIPTSIQ